MLRKKSIIPVVIILCLCVLLVNFQRKQNLRKEVVSAEDEVQQLNREIRRQGLGWTAGVTPLTKLTLEEKRMMLGEMLPEYVDPTQIMEVPEPEMALTAIDWRSNGGNWTTPAKDQGSCGSCWAFGLMSTFEAIWKIEQNQPGAAPDGSEMILLRCSGAGTCAGGVTWDAAGWMITNGSCPDSCYPYVASDGACAPCAQYPANAWRINSRAWITQTTIDNTAIKNALQQYGPLVGHMQVYNSFYSYTSGVYTPLSGETTLGGHAIAIVGFDDAQQCWICKNSWGTSWGDSGFFKITYNVTSPATEMGMWVIRIWGASMQNQPPVLGAVGNQTVKEGEQKTFQLQATDADQNTLTYSATGLPTGATLNTSSGQFSWTPNYTQGSTTLNNQYKDYAVTFQVSDGLATDNEAIVIRVYNRKRTKGRF